MTVLTARAQTAARHRPRVALTLVLLAAAMPVRLPAGDSFIRSVSVLDILLGAVAVTLVLDCAFRPPDVGHLRLFALLCVPAAVCALSVIWSQNRAETARGALVYAEGVVAYLFVLRELAGAPPDAVMVYLRRYTYLLIVPAVLLLLHVPGFGPEESGLAPDSDRYLTYYTRLSHPALGPSNNLGTVLAFFVPVLLVWGHVKPDARYTRAGYAALVAVAFTLSRGVALALLVAGLLAALGHLLRRRRISNRVLGKAVSAAAVVSVGVALLYLFNRATRDSFLTRFSSANSTLRVDYVAEAVHWIERRPVLGYGGGVAPGSDVPLGRVHNTYVQQVLGFGLLLGLVVVLALVGTAVFFFSRERAGPMGRAVGFAVTVQLIVFAVESSFEGTTLRVLFYLSVGLAAAVVRACEERNEAPERGS
ncbi:O-antigen ligase family protein [Streptomyces sp. 7R007]